MGVKQPPRMCLSPGIRIREADNWRGQADCRTTDPELFFNFHQIGIVAPICADCPVKLDCLDDVMSMPSHRRNVGQYRAGRWFGHRP